MERIQELYGFILSSKRREEVLKTLRKKPLRPFEIAEKTKYKAPNVSKLFFNLKRINLLNALLQERNHGEFILLQS